MPPSPPAADSGPRPSPARALLHVGLAGALGVLSALLGVPVVVVSLFAGLWIVLIVGVLAVTALVTAVAVGLDRGVGPRLGGTAGSVNRGVLLGVAGCTLVAVLGWTALRQHVGNGVPVPLRFATAAVVVPRVHGASAEQRREAIVREVGTTARPWVTDIDGLDGLAPRTTGSEYLWTGYVRDGDPTPVVSLLRMPNAAAMGGDPCRGMLHTPESTVEASSCRSADGVTWEREAGTDWRQLVRRVDGTWLGATARPDVPERLLEEALRNARPMSDDEYEDWLDAILTVPLE